MSASDDGPDARKERLRRGVAFLQRARDLPGLSPAQIDRIERHLNRPRPRARRPILTPVLAALAIVLLAGAALAVAGRGLGRLPVVGSWLVALFPPSPSPAPSSSPSPPWARTAPTDSQRGRADGAGATPPPAVAKAPPATLSLGGAADRRADTPAAAPAGAPAGLAPNRAPAVLPGSTGSATSATGLPPRARRGSKGPNGATKVTVAWSGAAPPASAPAPAPAAAAEPDPVAPDPVAQVAAPAPSVAAPVAAPSTPPSPAGASGSAILAESRSFGSALERWHRDHDAPAALAALDAHEQRFPRGEIRLEAQLLRAEIRLAGGQEREGLALLDPLSLAGLPRARELRTVRGELRIKTGRCADGRADLDAVLAEGTEDALAQRARRALVGCR